MDTSKNFKLFTAAIIQGLQIRVGDEFQVFSNCIKKNNGIELTGIMIKGKESNTYPTIYINDFFETHQRGRSISEIVDVIFNIFQKSKQEEAVDLTGFKNYERARKQIAFKLINYEKNWELLKDVPHKIFFNLAIVFYYTVTEAPFYGHASILIHNSHLQLWGICSEKLYQDAMENTPQLYPAWIGNIQDVMLELLEDSELETEVDKIPMYVLSNKPKVMGAACMLYPGVLKNFAQKMGCNLYILPSSIHEVILLPDDGKSDKKALFDMVEEINRTQVAESEVLADAIYYYERGADKIDRFC